MLQSVQRIVGNRSFELRKFIASCWTTVTHVGPHNHAHWPALRVSLCVTLALAATVLTQHPEWSGYAVFGAVSSVYGKQTDYTQRLRAQLGTGALLILAVVVGTTISLLPGTHWWTALGVGVISAGGALASRAEGWHPVPSLFLAFALTTVASGAHRSIDLLIALAVSTTAVAGSVAVGQAGRILPTSRRPRTPPAPRRSPRAVLADSAARGDIALHLLAPCTSFLLAMAAGSAHPGWAAVAATAPLAVTAPVAMRTGRALLRLGGTVAGAAVAYGILASDPPTIVLLIAVAVLQVLIELFVARNYGIAVIAITPIALVMSQVAAPAEAGAMAIDRVVTAGAGVLVTVVLLVAGRLLALAMGGGGLRPSSRRRRGLVVDDRLRRQSE